MVALIYYMALAGTCLSLFLLLPMLVGFGNGENDAAYDLLVYSLLGTFLFSSLLMAIRGREFRLDRENTLYLVVAAWIVFPLLAALPLRDLFAISYSEAVFEAVSAFTTTSAEGLRNPDGALRTAIFLRASIQWLGGLATLMTFVLILGPIRAGGMPKPRTSAGEAAGRTATGINRLGVQLIRAWLLLYVIAFALIMMSGVDAFSSAIFASSAVSTGAYAPSGAPVGDILGISGKLVVTLLTIIGATSIFWHRMILEGRTDTLRRHRESYVVIGLVLLVAMAFFVALRNVSGGTADDLPLQLSEALFSAASIVSTSAMESRPGMFALLGPMLILVLVSIGAGTYSTSGGIKLYRIGGMFFHAQAELSRLVYPHGVIPTRFGTEEYTPRLMKAIWTMFTAAITVMIVSSLLLAMSGMAWQASLTATIAAFANAGPVYSPEWVERGVAGWPAWSQMDTFQRAVLNIIMLAGRLEVIALVAVFNPLWWFRR